MHGSCLPLTARFAFVPRDSQSGVGVGVGVGNPWSSGFVYLKHESLVRGLGHPIATTKRHNNNIVRATQRESPYQVLGVSPRATPQQIKAAYRKLALKLHPDVNKEADAQEKFMSIKHAYNTLLNSEARRSDYSYSTTEGSQSRKAQDEEEFYGLEDFFRDIQTEFKNWEASADSQGKPKSLWEELADIGEEFVEFLEKELNITDSDRETENKEPSKGSQHEKSGSDQSGSSAVKDSSIEDNIDDIEATLAQLKRELGL